MSHAADRAKVAVEGAGRRPWLADAVRAGGGDVVPASDAEALVWGDPAGADGLAALLEAHPGIGWVQLPWAGIEPFLTLLDHQRVWTSGKGVYADPVAEHVIGLALAGMRHIGAYSRSRRWSGPEGRNLLGASVLILGAGGITDSLLRLLAPWDCTVTVVRKRRLPVEGADAVVPMEALSTVVGDADLVVLALALTPETERIIDGTVLAAMQPTAWLVNVARGAHVDTDALVEALRNGTIGGAALDVFESEPLPDGHPLWELDNCIITPHVGNTPEMAVPLLSERVTENVRRYQVGEELIGIVDVDLGY